MPLHDASYKHWHGDHQGIWGRRLVIAQNGINACLENKQIKNLSVVCWTSSLLVIFIVFALGQLLVADSIILSWIQNFNPQLQAFASMLTSWLEQHPELSVQAAQNVLFYYYSIFLFVPAIFCMGLALPLLFTRDLASNAIIIYSSKAISRGDYFFGKFGMAAGLMFLTWLGPILTAWFAGNLLAPDWKFFWHSRTVLFHILCYGVIGVGGLSLLAMGVSAISPKEKATTGIWFLWWILGGVLTPIALQSKPWLRHLSFNFNFDQMALSVFKIGNDLKTAQEVMPVLSDMLRQVNARTMEAIQSPSTYQAASTLIALSVISCVILSKKVKPE